MFPHHFLSNDLLLLPIFLLFIDIYALIFNQFQQQNDLNLGIFRVKTCSLDYLDNFPVSVISEASTVNLHFVMYSKSNLFYNIVFDWNVFDWDGRLNWLNLSFSFHLKSAYF